LSKFYYFSVLQIQYDYAVTTVIFAILQDFINKSEIKVYDALLIHPTLALFEVFKTLDSRGCFVMHSNSNSEFIKTLYRDYLIEFVEMERLINSKVSSRGKIKEVIIRNY